jgi:16S rRNA (uracil1498-N3)-methyltransferase
MVQKLTEIGVNKFMIYKPDLSDQSIAKKDFEKIISKSKEIIINVCKQCGNNFLPNIEYYSNLENAIKQIQEDHDKYIFDTDATEYFLQDELDNDSSVTIITGPESGFSNKEIKIIANGELKIRYLGRNILRSETAPIVVSSIIKNHFGRI